MSEYELKSVVIELVLDDEKMLRELVPLIDEAVMGLKKVGESAEEVYGFNIFTSNKNPFEDMKIAHRILIPRVGRVVIDGVVSSPITESILTYMTNSKVIKSWRYADE